MKNQNKNFLERNETVINQVKEQSNTILEQNKTILEKIDGCISNKSNNNFISSFEDVKNIINNILDVINSYLDFFNSFDLHQQLLLYNIMFTISLLLLLFSYIGGLYANYLIDKLDLSTRFPQIAKLLYYRLQYQKYYF